MRKIDPILIMLLLLVSSCHSYKTTPALKAEYEKRQLQKSDTLICSFNECTECQDLFIEHGKLTIPADLSKVHFFSNQDIVICGNFPLDLADANSFSFSPGLKVQIIGKVIGVDSNNSVGSIPLFFVEDWKNLKAK